MFKAEKADLPAYHSQEEILAHPRFAEARHAMLDAMLGLYEHEPFLNRLLLQVGRNVLFVMIMCLDARADEEDPATWVTLRLLTKTMTEFGLASPRRIADLVSRLSFVYTPFTHPLKLSYFFTDVSTVVFDDPSGADCIPGGVSPCGLEAGAPPLLLVLIGPVGPCG